MKAKIQVNGLDIELDGTSEEIAAVIRAAVAAPQMPFNPYVAPTEFQLQQPAYEIVYTGHVCTYPPTWNAIFPAPCTVCGVPAPVQTIFCGVDVSVG